MNITFKCLLIVLVCCTCACNSLKKEPPQSKSQNEERLGKLEWLLGSWQNSSENGELYETWTKENDSVFFGESFLIQGKDTVFDEKICLKAIGNELNYIPIVSNQNKGQAVLFKLVKETDGIFVFENLQHDFPQRIIYTNPSPDSLHAWIEGTENGKSRKEDFFMIRLKQ